MANSGPVVGPGGPHGPGPIIITSLGRAPFAALEFNAAATLGTENPDVPMVTVPFVGAVHDHHNVLPVAPLGRYSPGSVVAPLLSATQFVIVPFKKIL